jgi:hypothetical protein
MDRGWTSELSVFVPGSPAPFATAREAAWKAALHAHLGSVTPLGPGHLDLSFMVSPATGYPSGPDIDNLCEPVIAVLVGGLRFSGGSRPAISSLRAAKAIGAPTGCSITIGGAWVPLPPGVVLLDATYEGMPAGARDAVFAAWVSECSRRPVAPGRSAAVGLVVPLRTNLGEIATGLVKKTIDDCILCSVGGSALRQTTR